MLFPQMFAYTKLQSIYLQSKKMFFYEISWFIDIQNGIFKKLKSIFIKTEKLPGEKYVFIIIIYNWQDDICWLSKWVNLV